MSDTVTRITHHSYGERVSSAFCAILFCPVFVFLGSWLLIWNEGFSIKQHRALTEGSKLVVDVTNNVDAIDPKLNNLPVHFTGLATTDGSDPLVDPIFGVTPSSEGALKLKRYVEMYEWTESSHSETVKNSDGSTDRVTTYTYTTDWEDHVINSNSFEESFGHENPDSMLFDAETFTAESVHVGAFSLTVEILDYVDWFQRIPYSYLNKDHIPDQGLRRETSVYHNYFYYCFSSPEWPHVGDTRVSFFQVPSQVISVVALQNNGIPTSYTASNGNSFLLVEQGEHSTEIMFENAHRSVSIQTWLLRLLGFIIIWIGFKSLLEPMAVSTSCIPCIGDMTEAVANSVSFLLGFCVSIVIIAVAWLAYRPLLSVSLIVLAVCCGFCGIRHGDDIPTTTQPTDGGGWYDEVPTAQAVPITNDQVGGYGGGYDYQSSGYQKQQTPVTDQRLSYSNVTPIPVSHAMTYGEPAPPSNMTYGATAPPQSMDK